MGFDLTTAIPENTDENGGSQPSTGFDFSSAKRVSSLEETTFKVVDSESVLMRTAKDLFSGFETQVLGGVLGGVPEMVGREISEGHKQEKIDVIPFMGEKSPIKIDRTLWSHSPVGEAIDDFFVKQGESLSKWGKDVRTFFETAGTKGIESPNPAILVGGKHPFRKIVSLAAQSFPLTALSFGVGGVAGVVTKSAMKGALAGASVQFAPVFNDYYEDAVSHGIDHQKASDLALLSASGTVASEMIPIKNWMRGGAIVKRVLRTIVEEGGQEGFQQSFDNSLRTIGWDDGRPVIERVLDGVAESIMVGGLMGGAMGSFQSPSIEDLRYDLHQEIQEAALKKGLDTEQISATLTEVDNYLGEVYGIEDLKSKDNIVRDGQGKPIEINPPKDASSVISYVKDGVKYFTRLTKDELKVLTDENKNIPEPQGEERQIHLDAITSNLEKVGVELSREEFIDNHPQAKEVFETAKRISEGIPQFKNTEEADAFGLKANSAQLLELGNQQKILQEKFNALNEQGKEQEAATLMYGQKQFVNEAIRKRTNAVKAIVEKGGGAFRNFVLDKSDIMFDGEPVIYFDGPSKDTHVLKLSELTPETVTAKLNEFKQIKEMAIEQKKDIKEISDMLSSAEGPTTIKTEEGYKHIGSGWPTFLSKKGYTKKRINLIFEKALNNKPLTDKESETLNSILSDYRALKINVEKSEQEVNNDLSALKQKFPEITDDEILDIQKELDKEEIWDEERYQRAVEKYTQKKTGGSKGQGEISSKEIKSPESSVTATETTKPKLRKEKDFASELIGYTDAKGKAFLGIDKSNDSKTHPWKSSILGTDGKIYSYNETSLIKSVEFVKNKFTNPPTESRITAAGNIHPELLPPQKTELFQEEGELFEEGGQTFYPSIAPGEEGAAEEIGKPKFEGVGTSFNQSKTVPFRKEKMEFEKTTPWQVNLGRNITGVFEKFIGPKLQVSTRMKRWLGVYYPMLGENGLIRVRSVADETTLNHETGHFLDDVLGNYPIEKRGVEREELIVVTKFLDPFEEHYVPIIDKETGLPKKGKKGKTLMKQDHYTAYRRSKPELFAQYIALYTMDPDKAKQLAPNFTARVEAEIAKDLEFKYVIDKLREFQALMLPFKQYLATVGTIPEIERDLTDWVEKGNALQLFWREKIGDVIWNKFTSAIDKLGIGKISKSFFERGGIQNKVFEVLRQRKKLISGQQAKIKETLIDPLSKLNEEDQQKIAESLQRFDDYLKANPDSSLIQLTESTRKELTLWGNEARKLGLLNDVVFWDNIGQYFPFMYETKEFDENKNNLGYFPSKAIRAKFAGMKHKMTDEEFGRRVLESMLGTWPSSKQKIALYTKDQLEAIGRNAREEMGLIKTAAYPIQKRLFEMVEMIYTVKAFNIISSMPGIIGTKQMEGYVQMPEGKKYGDLSGAYVTRNLAEYVAKWTPMQSEIGKIWRSANTIWKMFKVPYNPASIVRNMVTNTIVGWLADVPVWNPIVMGKGINSFVTKNEIYQSLRDRGLYKNTYSEQELHELAFQIKEKPDNLQEAILIWANQIGGALQTPARLYGSIEDAYKTIFAQYSLNNGATVDQAVKFAEKWLFDYSSVSEATGFARNLFLPFATWSMKILPRLFETAIRKPEKIILILSAVYIWNAIAKRMLDLDDDEEERLKPDYIKGKSVLLMPERDVNGDLNWVDLSYFLPWGNWMPFDNGKIAVPDAVAMGGIPMILYNAFVTGYDPIYGEIAPDWMPEEDKNSARINYLIKQGLPNIVTKVPGDIISSGEKDKHGRKRELGKILSGDFLGVKFIQDTSAYQNKIQASNKRNFSMGRKRILTDLRNGKISKEKAYDKIDKLKRELLK